MDFQKLGEVASTTESMSRKIHKGRVLQYDADFACYEVADLDAHVKSDFKALIDHINMKRIQAGAEFVNAHITLGKKSGREEMATVQEYQENRDPDKPIKVRVRELRNMLSEYSDDTITPVFDLNHEADDIIIRYQHKSIKENGIDSSVIMSGDKDLWMGLGWHCNAKTGEMHLVKGFGNTRYKEVGNVKPKLVGQGRSWFWHQLIMGDKADNIPGLPKISNNMLDKYLPLKSGKSRKNGASACGEAKAVAVLQGVTTDKEAAQRVYELYWEYYGARASEMFIEQAYLLWMQRNENPWDVLDYFTRVCGIKVVPTERQRKVVEDFLEMRGY